MAADRRGYRLARARSQRRALNGLNPAIAFLAGLASFVSPCVLPLVPAYLAYLGARTGNVYATATPSPSATAPHEWGGPVAVAGAGVVAGLPLVLILFVYVVLVAVQPIPAYRP